MDAPTPRMANGKPDLSGNWVPFRGRLAAAAGAARRRLADPSSPPIATFFELGANMPGGLPFTPWAAELRKRREAANAKDNPDALCLPMGITQFHMHGQPRKMMQTPKLLAIMYEANYGLRYIYTDGRSLPPQGEPTPWWYGYSVGRWEGDELVVETNNLRDDGWLDVRGSPLTDQAKIARALPPADLRQARDRHHDRGPEGLHEAVHGASEPADLARTTRSSSSSATRTSSSGS